MNNSDKGIKLLNIDNKTFRVPIFPFKNSTYSKNNSNELNGTKISRINLEEMELQKMNIPCESQYRGLIIGRRGQTKKRILEETGIQNINVPSGNNNNDIIIEAYEIDALKEAEKKILNIINNAKNNENGEMPTHFLSLPLIEDDFLSQIQEIHNTIKNNIKEGDTEEDDFINTVIMPLRSMHLTIAVLRLNNEEEIEKAKVLMRSCSAVVYDLVRAHTPKLRLNGLDIMKGTVKEARVVHCKIVQDQGYNEIISVSNYLIKKFKDAGFLQNDRELKLHATILNTSSYRKHRNKTFDATSLFGKYGTKDFGLVKIRTINLCQMGTRSENGYKCIENIVFP